MPKLLAFSLAVALILPVPAGAYPNEKDLIRSRQADLTSTKLLDGVACNAALGARTWTATADAGRGFAVAALQMNFTQAAATVWQVAITASLDGGTSWAVVPPCDATTDGTCTLKGSGLFERTSATTENVLMRADFLGAPDIKIVVSCTGGGASDTFDLLGRFTGL